MIKRILANLSLCSAMLLPSATGDIANHYDPDIVFTQELFVNKSESLYMSRISREAGESQLKELCNSEKEEESWIHAKYANGERIWLENGSSEHRKSVKPEKSLVRFVTKLENKVKELSFYHFHPVSEFESNEKLYDDSQIPSPSDCAMCGNLLFYLDKLYPEIAEKADCRVAVSTGVYLLKPNPRLVRDEKVLHGVNSTIGDMKSVVESLFSRNSAFDYSVENRKNFAKENKRFAEKFSNEFIIIRFQEF